MKNQDTTPTSENLDAFANPDALWNWGDSLLMVKGRYSARGNLTAARALFPERPKGYWTSAVMLGRYAHNKATAMRCRIKGDIVAAQCYETICDQIYDRLPDYARFW